MICIQDKSKCSGCHACFSICPKKCIGLVADNEGFLYPQVDETECINCNLCEQICPILNLKSVSNETRPLAYAVKNTDEMVRNQSSSGGVFTALSQYILEQGGIVFGAAFDKKFNVVHIGVENKDDLEKLRGSKYAQSNVGNIYQEVKDALIDGRLVLFSGTPCQVGGLKAFLNKEYENLYTQDLICHGVPSPLVWKTYLEYLRNKYGSNIKKVTFRDKSKSWKKYSVSIQFDKEIEHTEQFNENFYMQAFLRNLSLRPSCYQCSFKGINRISDITLADFWGIENILPEMDDDKGSSLVIIHSEKGKFLLEKVANKLEKQEVNAELAVSENKSAIESSKASPKRKKFFKLLNKTSFDKLIKCCVYVKFSTKIKSIIKRCLGWNKR